MPLPFGFRHGTLHFEWPPATHTNPRRVLAAVACRDRAGILYARRRYFALEPRISGHVFESPEQFMCR